MKFKSHFKTATNNLKIGKLRTILALLGILVGTFSVVILVSSGQLAAETALKQFKGLGINLMSINFTPKNSSSLEDNSGQAPVLNQAKELKNFLEYDVPGVLQAEPYIVGNSTVSFEGNKSSATVLGSEGDLKSIMGLNLKFGRFFSPLDANQLYCVIGNKLIVPTLPGQSLVGKQIKIGNLFFTIIGGLNLLPDSSFINMDLNNSVFIPINTTPFLTKPKLSDAVLKMKPDADLDKVKAIINKYFEKKYPNYQVNIQTARELIKSMAAQQNIFTILLGSIGSIALFVAGIGIMNIMLAAVAERIEEIGLRLAIGAQPKDIRRMFLTEAILLAFIGGGSGVILGMIGTYIISNISGWVYEFLILPALLGFLISVLICVFFGFYPAYKASKLDPIVALRK